MILSLIGSDISCYGACCPAVVKLKIFVFFLYLFQLINFFICYLFKTNSQNSRLMFELWVISPGTLSLVYILRVRGLLEDFGCFKMLLGLFLIETFYLYFNFYCEKIIFIKTSPYILHNIL